MTQITSIFSVYFIECSLIMHLLSVLDVCVAIWRGESYWEHFRLRRSFFLEDIEITRYFTTHTCHRFFRYGLRPQKHFAEHFAKCIVQRRAHFTLTFVTLFYKILGFLGFSAVAYNGTCRNTMKEATTSKSLSNKNVSSYMSLS